MQINCNNKHFCEILNRLFMNTAIKENGYPSKIPLFGNHVTINGISHYFNDKKHVLEWNKYGQIVITCESKNHIIFNADNLTQFSFTAPIEMEGINPKTNTYYNTNYFFTF